MIVNFVVCIFGMVVVVVNLICYIGIKDILCRVSGYIIFVLIGVKMCNIILIFVSIYLNVVYFCFVKLFFFKICNVVFCFVFIWILFLFNFFLFLMEIWGEFIVMRYVLWCFFLLGGYGIYFVCFLFVGIMLVFFILYIGILRIVL